ncbi:similar to putative carotenoid oxygenase [Plenodomus lingam JN3]|uniref:Similar to putative carotenoid oxygenase n=1 Tax=Leptosphaeria maculans (strain JN3 / isolate v23.1.3 / race Av1-4-5-6-7-8) TaxID=985895 RepID=E4ZUB6_LEPMJ|nr:similar to putative carotenoid oxygenase [Plenodomus lingam JN3]CBX94995.1 similar to putative carotenoid oxygenase [Plenodomus lingam JN3]
MSKTGQRTKQASPHPYLSGNFAPLSTTWSPTPVTWTGEIPEELYGGMYVRNGGNPVTNDDLGREAHWFDGDGMLSGVWFDRSSSNSRQPIVKFVNQFILTDVYLSAKENRSLHTPIVPSISTLVNPASSLFLILWRIIRTFFLVLLSHLPGSPLAIKRISVANTSIIFHDGRALASCESGPPIRVTLPDLETVGWFNGEAAEGEPTTSADAKAKNASPSDRFGGSGLLSWMGEWTTGHPKVDHVTNEMVLFHCDFAPPYVHYSLVPSKARQNAVDNQACIFNAPVPGCSGGKLMHDFGVSRQHTIILDLPLSLTPLNLLMNKPIVCYEPEKAARFGVFPRRNPELVRWFETDGCCIFHTANTWDELESNGVAAVNMLACRLTSASMVFSAGNIEPPPHPASKDLSRRKPMSFFAKYDAEDEETLDPEKQISDETTPLLAPDEPSNSASAPPTIPMSYDEQEQCRLYYYRFALNSTSSNMITHQFALSAIPFEFPTVSPLTEMESARYIYGCSTSVESFGAALGKATKIDVLVKMDVKTLLAQAAKIQPTAVTGCVDSRTMNQILDSKDSKDPIKAFRLPPRHYAQEARFIPKRASNELSPGQVEAREDSGFLLFYVFDESQLDEAGQCKPDAKSELWVLDASTMERVVCRVKLPTRIPYGLHGNWFTEEEIQHQRQVTTLRSSLKDVASQDSRLNRLRRSLNSYLG